MAFYKKTIHEYDIHGKTVLLRTDYNVPIEDGRITDDYRIEQSLPTVRALLEKDCKVIICSHLGRPKGKNDKACSLKPVAKRLSEKLGQEVSFAEDCTGEKAEKAVRELKQGEVLLLENLRFHHEEEANDDGFAKSLAGLAEVFVQDGFGVVHRAHASTEAVTRHLPSVAGLLLEKEVDTITRIMENPERPLMAVIGGAKIADKLDIINRLVDIADSVAIGGAMANTFLVAERIKIGKSLYDKDEIGLAEDIIERAQQKSREQKFVFYLPEDGVVARKADKSARTRIVDWSHNVTAEIQNYPKTPSHDSSIVDNDEMILDIGPTSAAFIAGGMQLARTVIWNGTLGVTEIPALSGPIGPFSQGTETVVRAMLGEYGNKPFTLAGGGDTVGYIAEHKRMDKFGHVSTGGGASMELMAGKKLPGVEALWNKD